MVTDWFRRSTWTRADEDDFSARLRRSRPQSRSQYLRIQALHLAEAQQYEGALTLLDQLIAEYPDQLQLAQAHQQRAACLLASGAAHAALDAYREAVDAQRRFRQVQTTAPLDFAFAVAKLQRRDLYDEVLAVLEEFSEHADGIVMPHEKFMRSAASALILHERSRPEASQLAQRALQAAALKHSGIARHPSVGLVGDVDDQVLERLRRVAAS